MHLIGFIIRKLIQYLVAVWLIIYKVIIKNLSWLIYAYIFVTMFKLSLSKLLTGRSARFIINDAQNVLDLFVDEENNSLQYISLVFLLTFCKTLQYWI